MKKNTSSWIKTGARQAFLVSLLAGTSLAGFGQSRNTNLGVNTLGLNTTGDDNSAFGFDALENNTTGSGNTGIGSYALRNNSSGSENSASGFKALYSNTGGYANTASGTYSLTNNSEGGHNTATGRNSLYHNTLGSFNVAVGSSTMRQNTTGENNSSIGAYALYENTAGSYNTASGSGAMGVNTTGSYNTAIGYNALASSETGNSNTAVGFYAAKIIVGPPGVYNNFDNSMSLGYMAMATASDKVMVGNSNVVEIGGQVGWSTLSDARFKQNVTENVPGIEFIEQLRPVTYNYDIQAYNEHIGLSIEGDTVLNELAKKKWFEQQARQEGIVYTGFLAQEVEATAKKMGYAFSGVVTPESEVDHYSLRYAEFVVPLVKATQEQQEEIVTQRTQIAALEQEVVELKKLVMELAGSKTVTPIESSPVKCYPNPSKGTVNLGINNPEGEHIEISVFNLAGQLIYSTSSEDMNFNKEINLKDYTDGTYSIQTKVGASSFTNKVILQK